MYEVYESFHIYTWIMYMPRSFKRYIQSYENDYEHYGAVESSNTANTYDTVGYTVSYRRSRTSIPYEYDL